jgi:hypothetical protein
MKQTNYYLSTERGKPFAIYFKDGENESEIPKDLQQNTRAILRRCHEILNGGPSAQNNGIQALTEHSHKAKAGVEHRGKTVPYINFYQEEVRLQLVGDAQRARKEGKDFLKLLLLPTSKLPLNWTAGTNHTNDRLREIAESCDLIDEYVPREDHITPMLELALSGIMHPHGVNQKILFEHPVLPSKEQIFLVLKNRYPQGLYHNIEINGFNCPEKLDRALEYIRSVQAGPGTYRVLAKSSVWFRNSYFEPSEPRVQAQRLIEALSEAPEIISRMDFGKVDISTKIPEELLALFESKLIAALSKHVGSPCHYGPGNQGNIPLGVVFSYHFSSRDNQERSNLICQRYLDLNPPNIPETEEITRVSISSQGKHLLGFQQLLNEPSHRWLKMLVEPSPRNENTRTTEARRIFNWATANPELLKIQALDGLQLTRPYLQADVIKEKSHPLLVHFQNMPGACSTRFYCELVAEAI